MIKHINTILFATLLVLATFLYLYKLDFEYFFTDEVVYTQSGMAALKGDFSLSKEVPMLGKYIAGITASIAGKNIFLLRLPFALMGVVAVALVYLIVKNQFGCKWGIFAGIVYLFSPYIISTTRMIMMEPLLHLMWLLFHYCFFKFLTLKKSRFLIGSGVFMGLAMASKIPSVILYPFSIVAGGLYFYSRKEKIDFSKLKNFLYIYIISGVIYGLSYLGLFLKEGIAGLLNIPRSIYDTDFLNRDRAGKAAVIGDKVYFYSPSWFYLFYLKESYLPLHLIFTLLSPFIAVAKRSFFSTYWVTFFVCSFIFFQSLGVKAARYIASLELSLVFLMVVGLQWLLPVINKYLRGAFVALLLTSILIPRLYDLYKLQPTRYNALKNLLVRETNNFKTGERAIIYGSVRSGRWTFEDYPNKPVITRKDFEIRCDYATFKYIVFDKLELIKSEKNELHDYIEANTEFYNFREISGLLIFTKKENTYPKVDSRCFLKPGMGFN